MQSTDQNDQSNNNLNSLSQLNLGLSRPQGPKTRPPNTRPNTGGSNKPVRGAPSTIPSTVGGMPIREKQDIRSVSMTMRCVVYRTYTWIRLARIVSLDFTSERLYTGCVWP